MRRGGRFLATPLGKRYTTRWVYYMFGSDARLQGGHTVLVCLCASHRRTARPRAARWPGEVAAGRGGAEEVGAEEAAEAGLGGGEPGAPPSSPAAEGEEGAEESDSRARCSSSASSSRSSAVDGARCSSGPSAARLGTPGGCGIG
ncbi:unnamed protein product [Prorocentrum cordatum]|uniref:Uncharacterized protein n=1 Tax=Prorocentrum cordatum TaxID=2364126 RepID=A0ABN9RY11_9DINO|nr:unnamed protein product [Polarella glacialis]